MKKTEENCIDFFRSLVPDYSGEKILVAVSGGIDSMVCAHIFKKFKYPITIAHCNFQLRKEESDKDALFVKKWAEKNKLPYLEKKFNVKKSKGQSTQMVARDLRYDWFKDEAQKNGFAYIVTAHHQDDSIETSLMNMIRGTGISGMTGIPSRNGHIIRPMVHIPKSEIEAYARKEKIKWRTDQTNLTTQYNRNKIRHQLIPLLKKFNPNFLEVYANNMYIWQNVARIYQQSMARLKTELVHYDEGIGGFKISLLELFGRGLNDEILFELIAQFGFNSDQANQIGHAIHEQPGKKFFSKDHVLLIDRLFILIKPLENQTEKEDLYLVDNNLPFENQGWEIDVLPPFQIKNLQPNQDEIWLSYQSITWPIKIRKWKPGDKFTPMGMKGQKKISDFLTDLKVDRLKKEDTWIVETSKGKIAGVIGYRPDENFKISKTTKHYLHIKRKSIYF